jgi:hypothetical protein
MKDENRTLRNLLSLFDEIKERARTTEEEYRQSLALLGPKNKEERKVWVVEHEDGSINEIRIERDKDNYLLLSEERWLSIEQYVKKRADTTLERILVTQNFCRGEEKALIWQFRKLRKRLLSWRRRKRIVASHMEAIVRDQLRNNVQRGHSIVRVMLGKREFWWHVSNQFLSETMFSSLSVNIDETLTSRPWDLMDEMIREERNTKRRKEFTRMRNVARSGCVHRRNK